MANQMHLSISEMPCPLFNGLPERLNPDGLPPSVKLNQADGQFLLDPLLFIPGDAIDLSLHLLSDTLCISQPPGRGFDLSIAEAEVE